MILVDPLRWYRKTQHIPAGGVASFRKRWAHMVAGPLAPEEELHEFAELIGLRRGWFEAHPRHPHYDLRPRQWQRALDHGAMLVSARHLVRRIAIPICAAFEAFGCERGSTYSVSYDLDIPNVHFCSDACRMRWEFDPEHGVLSRSNGTPLHRGVR